MNIRANADVSGLLREIQRAAMLKKIIIAWVGKLVIAVCRPFPSVRRFCARAGITPAHFGNRAVRLPIPRHSKSILMTGAATNHLPFRLFWSGTDYYEPFTRTVIEMLTASSEVFIDVGANTGFFSLVAATLNPRLALIAFEPNPTMFRMLCENKRINRLSNLTSEPLALSNAEGETQLFLSDSDMSASLIPDFQKAADSSSVSVPVKRTTLDHYVQRLGLHGSIVIKVDVEGHEKAVLEGAASTISNLRPDFVIEVLGDFDSSLLDQFRLQGYRFYKITHQGLIESDAVILTKIGDFFFFNYLFTTRPVGDIGAISENIRQRASGINLYHTSKFATHLT